MTSPGRDMLQCIRYVRDMHEKMALFMQTAQAVMQEEGWRSLDGSATVTGDQSASLEQPARWMPRYLVRWFSHAERPFERVFVSIILDTIDLDTGEGIDEPLASAAWLRYEPQGPGSWGYDYALVWLRAQTHGRNPVWRQVLPESVPRDNPDGVESGWVLAHPLYDICSSEDISDRLVKPILQKARETDEAAEAATST